MVVSGHLQLNQTNHFQFLQPFEFNQILQVFELGKYGTNQTLFEIVFGLTLPAPFHSTLSPGPLSHSCLHSNPRRNPKLARTWPCRPCLNHAAHPLFSFLLHTGPGAQTRHSTSLATPSNATTMNDDDHRRRSRAQIGQHAARVAHAHATDTLWPRAVSPAQASPGPSLDALSIAVPPRTRQTRARHEPWPAAAGDDERIPPQPRTCTEAMQPNQTPPDRAVTAKRIASIRIASIRITVPRPRLSH
jgi:hypothetical protein